MLDSQFTIVLGALRAIENKLDLRCMGIDARMAKLEQRLNAMEINFENQLAAQDVRLEKLECNNRPI